MTIPRSIAFHKATLSVMAALLVLSWAAARAPARELARPPDDPRAILREAIATAEGIEGDHVRGERLIAIAEAQHDAGDHDAARVTARRALDAIDGSRGLDPVTKAGKLALVARAQAKIEGQALALTTLRRAVALASSFEPADDKGHDLQAGILAECAKAQAETGDPVAAREALERAIGAVRAIRSDQENGIFLLLDLEETARLATDRPLARRIVEEAMRLARSIGDPSRRGRELAVIAGQLVRIGEFDEALRILDELPGEGSTFVRHSLENVVRDLHLCGLEMRQRGRRLDRETRQGVLASLRQAAERFSDPLDQARALGEMARPMVRLGAIAGARSIAEDLARRARARAEAGDRAGEAEVRCLGAEVLATIALGRAEDRDRYGAEADARVALGIAQLPDNPPHLRAPTIERIARARATLGDITGARALADTLSPGRLRLDALLAIALAQWNAKDHDGARATLRRASAALPELARQPDQPGYYLWRSYSLKIAHEQVKFRDYGGGLETAAAVGRDAQDLVESIVGSIGRARTRFGDPEGAVGWAKGQATDLLRTAGLLGVAQEMVAEQRIKEDYGVK